MLVGKVYVLIDMNKCAIKVGPESFVMLIIHPEIGYLFFAECLTQISMEVVLKVSCRVKKDDFPLLTGKSFFN